MCTSRILEMQLTARSVERYAQLKWRARETSSRVRGETMAAIRWARAVLALLVVCTLVAACGSTESPSDDTSGKASGGGGAGEKVELKMLFNNSGQPAMEETIKAFHAANPNITINAQFVDGGALAQSLLPQLQAGNAPDLLQTQPGSSPVSPIVLGDAGKLADLSGEAWAKNIWEPADKWVRGSSDNKVYGYLTSVGPHGIAYNPELFAKAGVSIPKTFPELLAACKTLKAKGITPMTNGFAGSVTTGIVLGQILLAEYVYNVAPDFDAQRAAKQTTFAKSKEWRNAFQVVADLKSNACFDKNAGADTIDSATKAFGNAKAAMSILAFPQLGAFKAVAPDLKYEVFNFPTADGQNQVVSAAISQALSISATSKHLPEAKKFIAFLNEPEQSASFAGAGGGISATDAAEGKLPEYAAPMADVFGQGKVILSTHDWPNPTLLVGQSGVAGSIVGIMTGQVSVDKALANLDFLWDNPKATAAQ
jgi:raffinose/stachyose/melibiose transport system substrate-binding protein